MTIIDISIPLRDAMTVYRGNPPVRIRSAMTLRKDGVNLSELCLGSHTGTHVDAPSHFIRDGAGVDRLDLERFIGPAWVADPRRVKGGISAEDLKKARIPRGSRLSCCTPATRAGGIRRGPSERTLFTSPRTAPTGW